MNRDDVQLTPRTLDHIKRVTDPNDNESLKIKINYYKDSALRKVSAMMRGSAFRGAHEQCDKLDFCEYDHDHQHFDEFDDKEIDVSCINAIGSNSNGKRYLMLRIDISPMGAIETKMEIENPSFNPKSINYDEAYRERVTNHHMDKFMDELEKKVELKTSDTLSDKAKEVFGGIDNI